jgi:hypothetical protein
VRPSDNLELPRGVRFQFRHFLPHRIALSRFRAQQIARLLQRSAAFLTISRSTISRFRDIAIRSFAIRQRFRDPLFRYFAVSRFCNSLFRDSQMVFRDPLFRERFRDSTISRFAKTISRFALSRFANFFAIGYFAIRERLWFWASN